jgi:ribosomal protein S17E
VPIEKLDPAVLAVVREAEKAHSDSLMEDYEREVVKKYDEAKRDAYQAARKEASAKDNFNLHAFNLSQDKKFYDGFAAYCQENDSYLLSRKVKDEETGEEWDKYNQWTRATALVNKLCTRLSQETRNILAGYLDNLVIQYARNGLHNCLKDNRSIVQLHHALTVSEGFNERVPLDSFARTLDNYQLALSWVEACRETREEVRQHKAKGHEVEAELPAYPDPEYNEDFDGYVVDLCRSVRIRMAEEQTVAANKQKYLDASISTDFKRFCSFIIYEAILRVGAILKAEVALNNVKTVSEKLMYHALHQIHNACGIDFEPVRHDLETRLEKFSKWREERRDARKAKHNAKGAADDDEEEDDVPAAAEDDVVADEADAAAEEEVEEEVEDDAAEDDAIEYAEEETA